MSIPQNKEIVEHATGLTYTRQKMAEAKQELAALEQQGIKPPSDDLMAGGDPWTDTYRKLVLYGHEETRLASWLHMHLGEGEFDYEAPAEEGGQPSRVRIKIKNEDVDVQDL